ncbi:DEAD/DEAH box helicase [Planctomonas sp. JC2975]|uniref:DEAD/DEAH box helicase n=1 Tax=Planctomonas sp. JC2975 TaxID=2729626 RepID=UPI0014743FCD|nr:DEAD/DEAH box helicase [Planctomonas sp. JC2975]NNC13687.1 DEAD/DEAH box helicase [Planctomonas sp. JC2975]
MGLRDYVRSMLSGRDDNATAITDEDLFSVSYDDDGVNLVVHRAQLRELEEGKGGVEATTQLVLLHMLAETGLALPIPGGFRIPAVHAVRLDDGDAAVLGLPPRFDGTFTADIDAYTTSPRFAVRLSAVDGLDRRPAQLRGALLTVAGAPHLATPPQARALDAVARHSRLPTSERTEPTNVRLVADLQLAAADGLHLDLAHFTKHGWSAAEPEKVGVIATQTSDGGLRLSPALGMAVPESLLESRWAQLDGAKDQGVLRVEKNIILLDVDALHAAQEVLEHRTIRPEQVTDFIRTPSAFLDAQLVDLELGFSVRVEGVGRLVRVNFGDSDGGTFDWFASDEPLQPQMIRELVKTQDDLDRFTAHYEAARSDGADSLAFDAAIIDIRDESEVQRALAETRETIERGVEQPEAEPQPKEERVATERVGFLLTSTDLVVDRLHQTARDWVGKVTIDNTALARTPFPHQEDGIRWMLGLMLAAHSEPADQLYRLQGALLADDMGLGKTYMSLVATQHYRAAIERVEGAQKVKPTLIVAPLSLLENWEDEVEKTFASSPFSDVVVLQTSRDLARFRIAGAGRETMQLSSALDEHGMVKEGSLRIALRVGPDAGGHRLDMPGRLVLTTYETLRDYQFSLSQIDWGVVIFDEAQSIKNPDSMRTRAAKALKADFKLLATGTPIENTLGEFWCLVDTAQPGLLGDWQAFRARYLLPEKEAETEAEAQEMRLALGRELHQAIGPFMLRRMKEDHLSGLPSKFTHTGLGASEDPLVVFDPGLARTMPEVQRQRYDAHLQRFRTDRAAKSNGAAPLAVLTSLRYASLHPDLDIHGVHPERPRSQDDSRRQIAQSAKLLATMDILREVQRLGEKAIVFTSAKEIQLLLAIWIMHEFGIRPEIVNGDTSAVSKTDGSSRRQLIGSFESAVGFNVIIMSPIAAGVGLTVVGANHVIHLERHWNPAKEAQATDRAYRIGQTRDVHVYYPAATHPRIDSFDVILNRMLRTKIDIKDAVMIPAQIHELELAEAVAADSDGAAAAR